MSVLQWAALGAGVCVLVAAVLFWALVAVPLERIVPSEKTDHGAGRHDKRKGNRNES